MEENYEKLDEKQNRFNLIEWYKDKFILDRNTINELAQRNFNLYIRFVYLLILFAFGNEIVYFFINLKNLSAVTDKLFYFGCFAVLSVCMLIYCFLVKNCDIKKNYILKNIPFYLTGAITYFLSLYNFFILGSRINGFLIYEIISLVALLLYDYEPLLFFVFNIFPFCFMLPTIYNDFGLSTIADILVLNTMIVIFSFHKRKIVKKNYVLLNKQKHNIKVITFGNFTILYNQSVVKFQRKKSLELLAYLVYKKGTSVDSKELMCALWGERATSTVYGSSLRNLIVDIKQSLNKLNIMDFFIAEYNSFRINPSVIDCDYYNYLDGLRDKNNVFSGEFMNQYSWAEGTAAYLESL